MAEREKELAVRRPSFPAIDDLWEMMHDARWPFALHSRLRPSTVAAPALAPIDMYEKNGNIVVKAEMPGVEPDKIDVTVTGNELRITGERSEEKEVKEEDYFYSERSSGRIFRSVTLPEGADPDRIDANVKDGVLEVTVPKKQAAASKKIEVKSRNGGA